MDLKLSGRSALITGSSKGIGLAVAQWLAREGVHVGLVARSADRLEQEAAALRKATDVTVRTLPPILPTPPPGNAWPKLSPTCDILINNAGAIPGGTIDEVDEAAWRTGWELKVFGYIGLTRLYLQKMKERRRGVIINIIGAGGERLDYGYIAGAAGNAGLMAIHAGDRWRQSEFWRARHRRQSGPGADRSHRGSRPQAGCASLR